ncbi:MAG: hypothetical protein ACLP19_01380, partial [Xanthobacteraceae bacterium]
SRTVACPTWGPLDSMEFGIFRDGKRAFDIGLTNVGYRVTADGPVIQFELHEPKELLSDHSYDIEATFTVFE